jgi:hypothetical protein
MRLDVRLLRSGNLSVNFSALRSLTIGRTGSQLGKTFLHTELLLATLGSEFVDALDTALHEADATVHELMCMAELAGEDSSGPQREIRLVARMETPLSATAIDSIASQALTRCQLLETLSRAGTYRVSTSVHCVTAADRIPLF